MSALPDANAQAIVLGKHASMRAVLAGNCNRWMSQHRAVSLAQRAVSLGTVTDAGQNRCKTTLHLRTIYQRCTCLLSICVTVAQARPSTSTQQRTRAFGLSDDAPISAQCSIHACQYWGAAPSQPLLHSCFAFLSVSFQAFKASYGQTSHLIQQPHFITTCERANLL